MTTALVHRGPDGGGLLVAGADDRSAAAHPVARVGLAGHVNVGFGHRRLAIVDTSVAGHQPMTYLDRYALTYNGEIYNYIELRRELELSGHAFRSGSDTEVILAAYHQWGAECLRRFNGMWALALLDRKEQTLLLARDRLGVKPLYITRGPHGLYFASEIKALLHTGIERRPDMEALSEFVRTAPIDTGGRTMFAGVNAFPAASFALEPLDALLTRLPRPHQYWSCRPEASDSEFNDDEANRLAARYRELLADAIRLRLRADVPVGSALSGGLDSSSIVVLVNDQLRAAGAVHQQRCFSSTYPDSRVPRLDESHFVRKLTADLSLDGREITPTAERVRDEYARMIYAMDEPPVSTCMSGWFVFKLVADSGVVVTLDGQGADEQLAGYLYYLSYWLAQSRHPIRNARRARRMPNSAYFIMAGLALNAARRMGLANAARQYVRSRGKLHDPYQPLNERLWQDTQSVLARILHYADRCSMAHAIESRMPFLDYRLVEFCASVPATYKLHGGWTKFLARLAMNDRLPSEIVWRTDKQGWPSPDAEWLRGPLRDWAISVVSRSGFLRELTQGAESAVLLDRNPLVPFITRLNLALWHEVFFDRPVSELPDRYRLPARRPHDLVSAA